MADQALAATYDGATGEMLSAELSLPKVVVLDEVPSTMDVATGLASGGAPAGTLVLADTQLAGRGRAGRRWESRAGDGIWLTLLERVNDPAALEVLSLRIGIRVARALDRFASVPVGLKWPNDLYLPAGKLGGILVESRWRGALPEWTCIGVGLNVREVRFPGGAALGPGVPRRAVLGELVPAVRAAATARGQLSAAELAEFARRDVARGRACREPLAGRYGGIDPDGALLVITPDGVERSREGSLVLEEAT